MYPTYHHEAHLSIRRSDTSTVCMHQGRSVIAKAHLSEASRKTLHPLSLIGQRHHIEHQAIYIQELWLPIQTMKSIASFTSLFLGSWGSLGSSSSYGSALAAEFVRFLAIVLMGADSMHLRFLAPCQPVLLLLAGSKTNAKPLFCGKRLVTACSTMSSSPICFSSVVSIKFAAPAFVRKFISSLAVPCKWHIVLPFCIKNEWAII